MSDRPAGLPETTLHLVRQFAAPVEDVFEAWTDPALLQQWLAPWPCKITEASADPRPGGRYRIVIAGPFGMKNVTHGEYLEVVPNQRIVKTWIAEGKNPEVDRYPTLLRVEFHALTATTCEVRLWQEQLLTAMDRAGNRAGWRRCFSRLDGVLRSASAAPAS